MESRSEGPMFFRCLIMLFTRHIFSNMLLDHIMIIHPKSSSANVKVISERLPRRDCYSVAVLCSFLYLDGDIPVILLKARLKTN